MPDTSHTQDTSPPTLPAAQPPDHQNAIVIRPKSKQRHGQPMNCLLMIIAIMLIIFGSIIWILSIMFSMVSWSSICGAFFTAIGSFMTLLQLYTHSTSNTVSTSTSPPLPADAQPPDSLAREFFLPRPRGQEGILVVYTGKALRGSSVDLCRSFRIIASTYAAQNIVERKIGQRVYYIAVFRSLSPGRYTAHIYKYRLKARITIDPGQVTEIDWR